MSGATSTRTYRRAECVSFRKTDEAFGGLSNMAPGYPVRVNGVRIFTVEALYQACRFPHRPEVQQHIIGQASPMTAKMVSKPYRSDSRPDWDRVRVKIMRWCLRMKLTQHWPKFSQLLLSTGERPIVEDSRKDSFWGALPQADLTLVGMNVLGRLLMELREAIKQGVELRRVEPPAIPNFLFLGKPLEVVDFRSDKSAPPVPAMLPTNEFLEELDFPFTKEVAAPPPMVTPLAIPPLPPAEKKSAMIEGLNPYQDYLESEQAWLGRVPRHWPVLPNRAIFAEVKERDHPNEEMLSVTITKGIIRQKTLLTDSSKKDSSRKDKSAYKLVLPRDIAYNKMRAWQGAIGVSDFRGIISPAYVVMRLREKRDEPRFFHHLFRTPLFAKEAERWSFGITSDMWSLRPEHFKLIYTPQPPADEQAAIVRFLDYASLKIDGFIRGKRKLIGLLNEQKQTIIQSIITRGLNSDVKLKPSGLSWLGDIPMHWTLKRFKFIARINSGQVDPREPRYRKLVLIAPNHIQSGSGRLLAQETASEQGADSGKYLVTKGQIIYSKIRPNLRKATIAPCDCLCSADMYPITPRNEILPNFLLLLMLSQPFTKFVVDCSMRVAMPKVNREALANCWMWFPEPEEQLRVLASVEQNSAPYDTAIARTEREIELMLEYRARLTADVVTGKLDVREAAGKLPELPTDTTPEPIADEALEEAATEE